METTEEARIFTVIYGKLYKLVDHNEGYLNEEVCCCNCCFSDKRNECHYDNCLKISGDERLICRSFHAYWKFVKELDGKIYSRARVLLYFNGKVYEHHKAATEKCLQCVFDKRYTGDGKVGCTDTCRANHPIYFNRDSICSCLGGYWRELPIALKLPF